MRPITVAAACVNQTALDWSGNLENLRQAISRARDESAAVLCLPELGITGYGCEDAFLSPAVQQRALASLRELAADTSGMIVAVGLPLLVQNALYNCAAIIADGQLVGFVPKQHLAGDGIHYEPRWFHAWPAGTVHEVELDGEWYPVGDLLFSFGGVRIGFEVCEDAWVADRPGAQLARRGADIILNPSASHFAFGKQQIRRRFVIEGSRAFRVAYVYANLLGNEAGRAIYDGGAMIASGGTLLARTERLSFQNVLVAKATVDIDLNRSRQLEASSYRPDLQGGHEGTIDVDFEIPQAAAPDTEPQDDPVPEWDRGIASQEEEFTRAIALGLYDYGRKSRSPGFVVSLSGGADSAACAVLVWAMSKLASAELGEEAAKEKFGGRDVAMDKLLTTVYQATRNSGPVTLNAARSVADGLGATFYEFDIDSIVEQYKNVVADAIGRDLTWEEDDITLQNIQARVRSPSVWMLANLGNSLLLATSNRSEAAVGYATMDGDTSGGLSPIAGIDKAFLRTWLRWMEKTGPEGLEPVACLNPVNVQQPTAELRPPAASQTDEGDLMPYPLLDRIEDLAIRDKYAPVEIYNILVSEESPWAGNRPQLKAWIARFFRLWSRNQWKRERYAPSFHVDDKNLDPKTWCRFPILSGGFQVELDELEEA